MDKWGSLSLVVGSVGDRALKKYESGANVATVALYMEFGTEFSPSRPFIRKTLSDHARDIASLFESGSKDVVDGKSPEDAMASVGASVAKLMLQVMDKAISWAEPLQESTSTDKGSSTPLEDTGRLKKSIGYLVFYNSTVVRSGYAF